MLLVESRQIARAASSQSGKEEKRNDDEEGDNDKKSVDVDIGILRLGPFEDIRRSVAVVVHVFGQPGETLWTIKFVRLGVAVGVNLSARVKRERIFFVAESVVIVVLVVDVWTAGLAGVGVKPCVG